MSALLYIVVLIDHQPRAVSKCTAPSNHFASKSSGPSHLVLEANNLQQLTLTPASHLGDEESAGMTCTTASREQLLLWTGKLQQSHRQQQAHDGAGCHDESKHGWTKPRVGESAAARNNLRALHGMPGPICLESYHGSLLWTPSQESGIPMVYCTQNNAPHFTPQQNKAAQVSSRGVARKERIKPGK